MRHTQSGFTLIELMVVISVISLLSSVLYSITGTARARGVDAQTLSQAGQLQNAFALMTDSTNSFPDPGATNTYYCLGKTSAQNCKFWGVSTLTGNTTLNNGLSQYISSAIPNNKTITIDGLEYNSIVFKCKTRSGGVCTQGAIYWAQAVGTSCKTGLQVLSGSGGIVCGQNAGSRDTNWVETSPSPPPPEPPITCIPPDVPTEIPHAGSGNWVCIGPVGP